MCSPDFHLIGLLHPEQSNIKGYALRPISRAAEQDDLGVAWHFKRVAKARTITIRFLGVWDTVASVLVPRSDRFFIPSLLMLPYTRLNPSVATFRQAIAIDERRRMFRLNRWIEPQNYLPNPFAENVQNRPQDIKQVWFAGVHADIGGGYPKAKARSLSFPSIG